jgi:oligoribonuclease
MVDRDKINYFCWIDLEMTGLNHTTDRILEVAMIITDDAFRELDEFTTAVYQTEVVLDSMNDWSKEHHANSGLIDRVLEGLDEDQVERLLLEKIDRYFRPDEMPILCGNSIAQDRKFIDKYFLKFSQRLHYRMLDVSSFKILFQGIHNKEFKKRETHLALNDIRESIGELKYYLQFIDFNKTI